MPKVTSFVYAGNVIQGSDGALQIIAPLQIITPPYMPSTFSFFVVFSISDFDIKIEHKLRVTFGSVSGQEKPVEALTTLPPLPEEIKNTAIPDEYQGFNSSIGFQNVALTDKGLYRTKIYFDEACIGEYDIYAAKKQ